MASQKERELQLHKLVSETIKRQDGVLFAVPAYVGRGIYAGRDIIAPNSDFTPSLVDERGYLPVEWWIMSKTVALNPKLKEDEGLTSLVLNGDRYTLPELLKVAEKDLMGEYCGNWPLTKVLDIGGPSVKPQYTTLEDASSEIPPIPCHVHAGDVTNGVCTGHGKTEAYFFPPTDVSPYNLSLVGQVKTRLGLKPDTTRENVLDALRKFGCCDDMYSLLNVYMINPWETWFIEEKIIHAPGPWPTFEIQRPQDDFNLLAWQLGRQVPEEDLQSIKCSTQLKGLADEGSLFDNTVNFPGNVDPEFREKWRKDCEVILEGDWGRQLRLFYHLFYGEGFIIHPGKSFTREPDARPYAGIIWSGEGSINGLPLQVDVKVRKEFLVTPNSTGKFINTSSDLDLMIFTVFPMNDNY